MLKRLFILGLLVLAALAHPQLLCGQTATTPGSLRIERLRDQGFQYEFTDSAKAFSFYQQALKLAQLEPNKPLESRVWVDLGRLQFNFGHYQKAIGFYSKAYEVARTSNNELGRGKAMQAIGNAYYMLNEPEKSTRFLLNAARIQEKVADTLNLAITYSTLASVFEDANQLQEALKYALESQALSKAVNKHRAYANACINAAIIYLKLDSLKAMQESLEKALSVFPWIEEKNYKLSFFQNISALNFDSENYQKANKYADSALVYLREQSDSPQKTAIQMSKGLALLKLGKIDEAQELLAEANKRATQEKDFQILREIHLSLSEAFVEQGNWKEAYLNHALYSAFHDSLLNAEAYEKAAELATQYESEKKAIALEKLRRENQLNAQLYEKQRALLISLSAAVLLGLLLFILLYWNQKRKNQLIRKNNELQAEQIKRLETEKQNTILDSMLKGEENERSRVAKDLHDGVGSLLSGVKLSLSSMQGNLIVNPNHASLFDRSLRQLDDAIREMRRVAHNMMPEALIQKGLLSAITSLCAGIEESGGPKIHFEHHGIEGRLPSSYEIILYRLVQELANNTLKHAQAQQIVIQLSIHDQLLTLEYEDDGRGFDPQLWEKSTGIGFYTMKSRVEYLRGKVHLQSRLQHGTSFLIEFNLPDEPAA